MIKLLLSLLIALGVSGLTLLSHQSTSEAAIRQIFVNFTCKDNKATLSINWPDGDPGAREHWVDLSTTDNKFGAGSFTSAGPLGGRASSYTWDGLEVDAVYWLRVNEQVADGSWVPSPVIRLFTPCGVAPIPAGATFKVTGFVARTTDSSVLPADATPPGGTLQSCNPKTFKVFAEMTGITGDTSIYYQLFSNDNAITGLRPTAFGDGAVRYSVTQNNSGNGWTPGVYLMRMYSGTPGNLKTLAEGSFTLTC